jgi:hypothetical protein
MPIRCPVIHRYPIDGLSRVVLRLPDLSIGEGMRSATNNDDPAVGFRVFDLEAMYQAIEVRNQVAVLAERK